MARATVNDNHNTAGDVGFVAWSERGGGFSPALLTQNPVTSPLEKGQ
jgi:hypothetical protein